jgi:hypothetical protein
MLRNFAQGVGLEVVLAVTYSRKTNTRFGNEPSGSI